MPRWIPFALVLLPAAGCGPTGQPSLSTPLPVTGKAAFDDGSPLTGVQLYFRPTDAPAPAYGTTSADGSFTLTTYEQKEGICKGKYMVFVRPVVGNRTDEAKAAATLKRVPERLKDDSGSSPVEVEVTSGTTSLDIRVPTR